MKLTQNHQTFKSGSIVDVDEITYKELIDSKVGEAFTETNEQIEKAVEEMVNKEMNMSEIIVKNEVKDEDVERWVEHVYHPEKEVTNEESSDKIIETKVVSNSADLLG